MTRVLLTAMIDDPSLVKVVRSPKVAEMSKLAENTYRAVNIAYVNELAMLAHEMDVDIWEVIEAAATKPFGFQRFVPGIGPGGQCIPVNPYYISWKAREFDFHTSFIELAGDINLRMTELRDAPHRRFTTRLGSADGLRVLCLGAAFKAGVSDVRNSRAVRSWSCSQQEGARRLQRRSARAARSPLPGRARRGTARVDRLLGVRPHRGPGAQPGVAGRHDPRRAGCRCSTR